MHRWLLREGTISPVGLSRPPHIIHRTKSVAHYYCSTTKAGASGSAAILSTQPIQLGSGRYRSTLPTFTEIQDKGPRQLSSLYQLHHHNKVQLSTIFSLRH